VRKLFGWLAGLVGIAALARLLARRKSSSPLPRPPAEPDPAIELRRKLSESRETAPAVPTPPQSKDAARESVEDRRARVHAKALEAIDEMKEPLP